MKNLIFAILVFSISLVTISEEAANTEEKLEVAKINFTGATKVNSFSVEDPISEIPSNTSIVSVYHGSKLLGFFREIQTTTGCNSACLPLTYTAFYNERGEFLKISSKTGLTKKNHAKFDSKDYAKLNLILTMAPKKLSEVIHPKSMTDAISGETLKLYKDDVVSQAAYSTLRIHLYNQLTLKQIQAKLP